MSVERYEPKSVRLYIHDIGVFHASRAEMSSNSRLEPESGPWRLTTDLPLIDHLRKVAQRVEEELKR